jgi:hypothetical protein
VKTEIESHWRISDLVIEETPYYDVIHIFCNFFLVASFMKEGRKYDGLRPNPRYRTLQQFNDERMTLNVLKSQK